jgi:hypothetical protein
MAKKVSARVKNLLRSRAKGLCEYCQSPERFSTYGFSADHIVPTGKGGSEHLENLAFCCQGCNNFKYNKTEAGDPVSGKIAPLFNPRKDRWQDHFTWNVNFSEIVGRYNSNRQSYGGCAETESGKPDCSEERSVFVGGASG